MNRTESLPMVALRGMTILPEMVAHFDISRERSIEAVQEAMASDQKIFLLTQKDVEVENPGEADLYRVGTVATVKQIIKLPKQILRVLVSAEERAVLNTIEFADPYLRANITIPEESDPDIAGEINREAMMRGLRDLYLDYAARMPKITKDMVNQIKEITELKKMVNQVAANMPLDYRELQEILEELDFDRRYELISFKLVNEMQIMNIRDEIQMKVKERVDKHQREYILREQLKLIREELGEDTTISDAEEFAQKAEALDAPDEVKEKLKKEISRFKNSMQSPAEAGVIRTYIETMLEMPWNKRAEDFTDIAYAKELLEAEHYGLEEVKERVLEFLAVRALTKKGDSPILCLVGPPGTGKTTTLVEAIYETLHREPQVLVCAQSNTAVDWICEKLVDRGVPVLRIGNPTRVNDKMLSSTYERRFESHPAYPELWGIRKSIREMGSRMRRGSYSEREGMRNRMSRLRDRATELEIQINADLFDSARVIASTLVSSNHRLLNGRRFPTLFIDEAAQALEAACWIAIRKADRVILAGDHCQLPPTIKCIEASRGGLDHTLMEKVVQQKPSAVSLLKVQYRMHEAIMQFPSDWFYHGELEAAPEVRYRGILDFDTPMNWIDTSEMDFHEDFVGESFGRINKQEANLLLQELETYIERIGKKRILDERIDFGLISPYKAQVQYLRGKIKGSSFLRPFRSLITVNTVDGFQGQERDVIFISLVRANEDGQIGFLNDLRRMNVAITRARMKLVILGDASTLTKHPFYKRLMLFIKKED